MSLTRAKTAIRYVGPRAKAIFKASRHSEDRRAFLIRAFAKAFATRRPTSVASAYHYVGVEILAATCARGEPRDILFWPTSSDGRIMKQYLLSILRLLPFGRQFHLCSAKDFREAGLEVLITTIFSSMPLWLSPLIGPLILKTDVSYTEYVVSTVSGGELLVYCAALAGPLTYIITRKYGERSDTSSPGETTAMRQFGYAIAFPHGAAFMFFSALICIVSGFSFSLMKNPAMSNDVTRLNLNGIFWTSIGLYLFSLYCIFWASAYRNAMAPFVGDGPTRDSTDPARQTTRDEDDFSQQWEQRNAR